MWTLSGRSVPDKVPVLQRLNAQGDAPRSFLSAFAPVSQWDNVDFQTGLNLTPCSCNRKVAAPRTLLCTTTVHWWMCRQGCTVPQTRPSSLLAAPGRFDRWMGTHQNSTTADGDGPLRYARGLTSQQSTSPRRLYYLCTMVPR